MLYSSGKIHDMYTICEKDHLLRMVTSDRISAFDVRMDSLIPGRGKILNNISTFWCKRLRYIIDNHLVSSNDNGECIVIKLKPVLIECIVRGYLHGNGWKDYQNHGSICGIKLPSGLQLAEKLSQPIYTPTTKSKHDVNITFNETIDLVGEKTASTIKNVSLRLYAAAQRYALKRDIIIADTKFEFGTDETGKIYLIDEVLTPDSSRYWDLITYKTGISPPSFDKQILRDYLIDNALIGSTGIKLPNSIINKIVNRYNELQCKLLTI